MNGDVLQMKMNLKTYTIAVAWAYTTIQLSGLILGATFISLITHKQDALLESLSFVPIAMLMGWMLTGIPTVIYALLLPAIVSITQRYKSNVMVLYTITSLLTLALLIVTPLLCGFSMADIDGDLFALFMFAFPSGWVGTHITRKKMQNKASEVTVANAPEPQG